MNKKRKNQIKQADMERKKKNVKWFSGRDQPTEKDNSTNEDDLNVGDDNTGKQDDATPQSSSVNLTGPIDTEPELMETNEESNTNTIVLPSMVFKPPDLPHDEPVINTEENVYNKENEWLSMDRALPHMYWAVLLRMIQPILANRSKTIEMIRMKLKQIKSPALEKWTQFLDDFVDSNYEDTLYGQCLMNVVKFLDYHKFPKINHEKTIDKLKKKLQEPIEIESLDMELNNFSDILQFYEWDKQEDCSDWKCHQKCGGVDAIEIESKNMNTNCIYKTSWLAWKKVKYVKYLRNNVWHIGSGRIVQDYAEELRCLWKIILQSLKTLPPFVLASEQNEYDLRILKVTSHLEEGNNNHASFTICYCKDLNTLVKKLKKRFDDNVP